MGTDERQEYRELIAEMRAVISELRETNARQSERIAELESRLKRDSRTSSKPPSSDAPWSKRRKRRKPPSGKRQGAQPGHKGETRPLADDVDETIDHRPQECSGCGSEDLVPLEREPHRHQVWELPPVLIRVTEHRLHRARCQCCGEVVAAGLPIGVTSSNFGPRLSALAASLSGVYRVSRREVTRLLADVFGVTMSPGTVSAIEGRLSEGLSLAHLQALGSVRRGQVAYVDETPWKQRGVLGWLWTAVGEEATAHRIDRRRNAAAMRRIVGSKYKGVLVTDRMGAYDKHPLARRQLCWAHIERHFRGLAEGPRGGQAFGRKAADLAQAVMRAHRGFRTHADRERLQREIREPSRRLRRLLERGAKMKRRSVNGISRHLLARFEALWTFAQIEGVDPTNNIAERAVRKPVLWRRSSFGSQSERGLRFAERILTVTATLRRRGGSVFDYLAAVADAMARGLPLPDLVSLPAAN